MTDRCIRSCPARARGRIRLVCAPVVSGPNVMQKSHPTSIRTTRCGRGAWYDDAAELCKALSEVWTCVNLDSTPGNLADILPMLWFVCTFWAPSVVEHRLSAAARMRAPRRYTYEDFRGACGSMAAERVTARPLGANLDLVPGWAHRSVSESLLGHCGEHKCLRSGGCRWRAANFENESVQTT